MNKQIFLHMNVAFERQIHLLKESSDKAFLQASFQQPVGDVRLGSLQTCSEQSRREPVLTIFRKVFYTPNLQKSIHDFNVHKGQISL